MDIFIKGKNVNLVVLNSELADKTKWYNWFNSEKTTRFMQKHYYPNDKNNQIIFAKEINKSNDNLVLGISENEKLIGVCGLHEINLINSNCSLSIIIGEKFKNQNVTLEAFYLLLKHAFYTLNLNKVKMGQHKGLKLFTLKLYAEFGFFQEGILKDEMFKNGNYYDVILSAVFKNEFDSKIKNSTLDFLN